MRHGKRIVKATEDRVSLLTHAMLTEDAEHLLRKQVLLYSVVMIQTCLSRPADIHRRCNVRATPVEYLRDLVPVVHLLKLHVLHRRTRDYHTVEFLVLQFVEIAVEHHHVLYRGVL